MARAKNTRVALLSIHPTFARGIIDGSKTVEFRRRTFGADVSHVVVYATAPVRRILGVFSVARIDSGSPAGLWRKHARRGLIGREPFNDYFSGVREGFAIVVDRVSTLGRPMTLKTLTGREAGPQSYQYVSEAQLERSGLSRVVKSTRVSRTES